MGIRSSFHHFQRALPEMIRRLPCPVCNKELPVEIDGEASLFPFCSIRCKQIDLYRWMSGDYALIEKLTLDQVSEEIGSQDPSEMD